MSLPTERASTFRLVHCDAKTSFTRPFFMVTLNGRPLGNPIEDTNLATAIITWLKSVNEDEVDDSIDSGK